MLRKSKADVVADVHKRIEAGVSRADAIKQVASEWGYARETVVDYLCRAKAQIPPPVIKTPEPTPEPIPKPLEPVEEKLDRKLREKALASEVNAWQKQAEKYRKQLEARETLFDTLRGCVSEYRPVEPPRIEHSTGKSPAEMMTAVSDYHAGRVTKLTVMEGLNEYNWEIFCARWWQHVVKVIEITRIFRHEHDIRKLFIAMLGDLFNNETRIENIRNNVDWNSRLVFKVASVYFQGLRALLTEFDELDIIGIAGNESRLPEKISFQDPTNNWDWVLYQLLKVMLADEVSRGRVNFVIPDSAAVVAVRESGNYLLSHGNEIRGGYAGLPHYGIARRAANEHELRRPSRWNPQGQDFDYWFFAHFHTQMATDHERHFCNGSGCGADPYARTGLGRGGPAMQRLLVLTEKHGVTYQAGLSLQDAKEHPFVINEAHDPLSDVREFDKRMESIEI